ncbi:LacI family DNA-binding transcriptional regulator [Oceanirhabdus seepicola]|uniref:LacI family DNA-binding transcriptional regulator n=1 Tax=Oceanirhabdus seepicola TaxID=2828781 RepID=A0A9J6NZ31_9CLOT|nr:LacI family DNA-binding transcriptional regulator [Oceanirhabdus seepicola]MCM1989161.1 LacI family DNA-binding transcriptional regulator [Oceanirhabdus seepicola]
MSITIKDIAKLANVSHTTVSRALNNSPLVNDETKTKIKEIAKQYNYIPNYNARSLKLDKSYNIGLFFTSLGKGTSSSFFHKAVIGVNKVIKDNYNLVIRGVEDYNDYSLINAKHFDGIILVSQSEKDNDFIVHSQKNNIPIVVVNRLVEFKDVSCFLSDDRVGAYKVVDYLIQEGHEKIAFIKGKEGYLNTEEREKGYLQALIDNNISIIKSYIANGEYSLNSGYNGMKKILENEDKPTVVFCSNDDMAVGAIKAIEEEGLSVPEDISVVGFDESEFSKFTSPELTTVRRYIEKISEEGTKKLLKIIDSDKDHKEITYINSELIIRKSVEKIKSFI